METSLDRFHNFLRTSGKFHEKTIKTLLAKRRGRYIEIWWAWRAYQRYQLWNKENWENLIERIIKKYQERETLFCYKEEKWIRQKQMLYFILFKVAHLYGEPCSPREILRNPNMNKTGFCVKYFGWYFIKINGLAYGRGITIWDPKEIGQIRHPNQAKHFLKKDLK
jgi:hypothetical protein